jgi:acetolactate synthase-1/2/3 large subunit
VETIDEVDDVVRRAWDTDDSLVIDFRVEREVNVFPIVPQGKGIHEMLTEQAHEEASV